MASQKVIDYARTTEDNERNVFFEETQRRAACVLDLLYHQCPEKFYKEGCRVAGCIQG